MIEERYHLILCDKMKCYQIFYYMIYYMVFHQRINISNKIVLFEMRNLSNMNYSTIYSIVSNKFLVHLFIFSSIGQNLFSVMYIQFLFSSTLYIFCT